MVQSAGLALALEGILMDMDMRRWTDTMALHYFDGWIPKRAFGKEIPKRDQERVGSGRSDWYLKLIIPQCFAHGWQAGLLASSRCL